MPICRTILMLWIATIACSSLFAAFLYRALHRDKSLPFISDIIMVVSFSTLTCYVGYYAIYYTKLYIDARQRRVVHYGRRKPQRTKRRSQKIIREPSPHCVIDQEAPEDLPVTLKIVCLFWAAAFGLIFLFAAFLYKAMQDYKPPSPGSEDGCNETHPPGNATLIQYCIVFASTSGGACYLTYYAIYWSIVYRDALRRRPVHDDRRKPQWMKRKILQMKIFGQLPPQYAAEEAPEDVTLKKVIAFWAATLALIFLFAVFLYKAVQDYMPRSPGSEEDPNETPKTRVLVNYFIIFATLFIGICYFLYCVVNFT